jgi:hypothetical protein
MPTEYDSNILQKYADGLYRRAATVLWSSSLAGLFFGLCAWAILANVRPPDVYWFLAPAGLVVGFFWGRDKAFKLRLEAQRTLCQVQIEMNTRGLAVRPDATKSG